MFDTDADLFARSRAYIEATATPRDQLAAASGLDERDLAAIEVAGALPAPTYVVFENAIRSPIRALGEASGTQTGRAYYCPSVLWWLRRAALMQTTESALLERLEGWFAGSFAQALHEQATDARRFGWAHLFDASGVIDARALATEVRSLCADWLNGGWAVCLRRWDGRHAVTKDLERARIAAITNERSCNDLSANQYLTLLDAIDRLDSVMLPFSPYERPHGTPGLFIDAMRKRYSLWV